MVLLVPPTSHAKETLRVIFKIIKSGRGMARMPEMEMALSLQIKLRHSKKDALCESLTFKPFNNSVERRQTGR